MGYNRKKTINNAHLFGFVTSKRNIYRAIYALESYIDDPFLLSSKDLRLYFELSDKYNWKLIDHTIEDCQKRLRRIITKKDVLFDVTVYYSLKKLDEDEQSNKKLIYRPLHTASLLDQICMVAMLQILMFEDGDEKIWECQKNDSGSDESGESIRPKFTRNPSDLSKSIPDNFYGNKWSKSIDRIYQYWVPNYQKYNKHIIDSESTFAKSHEYEYEVTLDIKNFFPSISPIYLYKKICYVLKDRYRNPSYLNSSDDETDSDEDSVKDNISTDIDPDFDTKDDILVMKRIIAKLLFLNIKDKDNVTDDSFSYYGKLPTEEIKTFLAKGVAQGLPQSYFFGNLCMTDIRRNVVTDGLFKGEDFFYVDDSVIYVGKETLDPDNIYYNDKTGEYYKKTSSEQFDEKITLINQSISSMAKICDDDEVWEDLMFIVDKNVIDFHHQLISLDLYSIIFHNHEKSHFAHIDDANVSRIELDGLTRQNSGNNIIFDLEGDDNEISYEKFNALEEYVIKMTGVMETIIEDAKEDQETNVE